MLRSITSRTAGRIAPTKDLLVLDLIATGKAAQIDVRRLGLDRMDRVKDSPDPLLQFPLGLGLIHARQRTPGPNLLSGLNEHFVLEIVEVAQQVLGRCLALDAVEKIAESRDAGVLAVAECGEELDQLFDRLDERGGFWRRHGWREWLVDTNYEGHLTGANRGNGEDTPITARRSESYSSRIIKSQQRRPR